MVSFFSCKFFDSIMIYWQFCLYNYYWMQGLWETSIFRYGYCDFNYIVSLIWWILELKLCLIGVLFPIFGKF